MDPNDHIKETALRLAVQLHGPNQISIDPTIKTVLAYADALAQWLGSDVVSLLIVPDRITYDQNNPAKHSPTMLIGGKVELKDNQQVRLTLHAKDAKGFDASEPEGVVLSWTSSDETVVTLQSDADGTGTLAVAGNPGSAMVQISDGTRTGSLAIDVTTGDVSAITVEAGVPEDQPAAP